MADTTDAGKRYYVSYAQSPTPRSSRGPWFSGKTLCGVHPLRWANEQNALGGGINIVVLWWTEIDAEAEDFTGDV